MMPLLFCVLSVHPSLKGFVKNVLARLSLVIFSQKRNLWQLFFTGEKRPEFEFQILSLFTLVVQ